MARLTREFHWCTGAGIPQELERIALPSLNVKKKMANTAAAPSVHRSWTAYGTGLHGPFAIHQKMADT